MFHHALKVLLPVVVTLSLTLGALAWSASNVAFASNQTGLAQATTSAWPTANPADQTQAPTTVEPTATPTPAVVYGAGYPAPFYSPFYGPFYGGSGRFSDRFFNNERHERRMGERLEFCFPRRFC